MKEDKDEDDAKDECRVVFTRNCDMNEVFHWQIFILLDKLIYLVHSELIIKTLDDLFPLLRLELQDSNAGVNHLFRVVT